MRLTAWIMLLINLALLTQQLDSQARVSGVLWFPAFLLVVTLLITS